jgi:hypothetical protein
MSISDHGDHARRLVADDLKGQPRLVTIVNVTLHGLENMTPVLHFTGQSKRLALTADQARQMVAATGTGIFQEWIGATVVLVPEPRRQPTMVRISPPDVHRRVRGLPPHRADDQKGWRFALLVVGTIAAASTVYLLAQVGLFSSLLGGAWQVP